MKREISNGLFYYYINISNKEHFMRCKLFFFILYSYTPNNN